MPFAECMVLTNPYDTGRTWRASKQEKVFIVHQCQDRAAVLHCDEYVWHFVPWPYICHRVLNFYSNLFGPFESIAGVSCLKILLPIR